MAADFGVWDGALKHWEEHEHGIGCITWGIGDI
jgi:hypothetical protein